MSTTIRDVRATNQVMLYIHRNLIRSFGTLYKLSGTDTSSFSDKVSQTFAPYTYHITATPLLPRPHGFSMPAPHLERIECFNLERMLFVRPFEPSFGF